MISSLNVNAVQDLRKLDIPDLSNNAVLYMHQDNSGNMWFGTYDGLNLYNGKNTFVYRYEPGNENSIDANIIRKILDAGPDHLWVSTILGINRISLKDKKVIASYPQYADTWLLAADSIGHTLIISLNDFISYYSPKTGSFQDIYVPGIKPADIKELFIDESNQFYMLTFEGLLKRIEIDSRTLPATLHMQEIALHTLEITNTFYDENKIYFVDIANKLYQYDCLKKEKKLISDISSLKDQYKDISRILSWNSDIYISFMNNGLVKLNNQVSDKYSPLAINVGVFCLYKDKKQDILWIGTDGQGVQMCYEEDNMFDVLMFENIPGSAQKPIRSIYTDEYNTLWIGTKGDGVFRIQGCDNLDNQPFKKEKVNHYTVNNGLSNNQVFCFLRSQYDNILWMGTEGPGLSYYSYKDEKVHTVDGVSSDKIRWVHSLCEINDSVLWLATTGGGLMKATISRSNSLLKVKIIEDFVFERNGRICDAFHSMIYDGDSILTIGSRGGYGVISFNIFTNEYKFFSLDNEISSAIGDILSVYKSKDSIYYWGASSGFAKLKNDKLKQFSKKDGIANDMIHGILEDNAGCLWLSTNRGLTKYNPRNDLFHNLYHPKLKVTEFSDDAYWKCPYTDRLFFGGINGLVWLKQMNDSFFKYSPELRFLSVTMGGKISDLSTVGQELIIQPNVSSFTVSFIAIDYINGDNYEYSYLLDNYNSSWIELQKNNEVTFSNLPYGRYILRVKYKNDVFDTEIKEYFLPIYIKPPWYLSIYAIFGYILLLLSIGFCIFWLAKKRFQNKQEFIARKLKDEQKEKIYEAKLNFFTNITHELCTPLTIINGITENIQYFNVNDPKNEFSKNINILRENVRGLNELIQEILDFRKVEQSEFTKPVIKKVNISEFIHIQCEMFYPAIEKDQIDFQLYIPDQLFWYTDISSFKKIFVNLMSNAFKYVNQRGTIKVTLAIEADILTLKIFNTGQGIEESKIQNLFDRYKVLDHMGENKYIQMSARNGLGLFICYNLVQLLHGEINILSEINGYTEVIVSFPNFEENKFQKEHIVPEDLFAKESTKPTILVVDDNKDIVWLISTNLSADYDIKEAYNVADALSIMEKYTPALIITDIIMPEIDGLELIKKIKSDKFTKHIPIIIISAKITDKEQAEGLNLGADAYLTKPFSSLVLNSTVNRLISTKKDLKEYYYSPESAYQYSDGQLLHQEDKDFMNAVKDIIQRNLDKDNLRPELIAEKLGLTTRNLYRRFKKLTSLSPSDYIKDYRFNYAAQLLVTTNLNIQEIIYKVGISNKSYFYREFYKKYQMTPKEYRSNK